MTHPSEDKCWCGHVRRWHMEPEKFKGQTMCQEFGCSCRKFEEALP